MMKKSFLRAAAAATLILGVFCAASPRVSAQQQLQAPPTQKATVAADALASLPASEMVMTFDVRRIMDEAVPRLLANAPVARSRFDSGLNTLKAQTNFDARSIDRIVIGMGDFDLSGGAAGDAITAGMSGAAAAAQKSMPRRLVAITTGKFNAPILIAAARLMSDGKYKEEPYGGQTLYTFALDSLRGAQPPSATPSDSPISEVALVALDEHTIAFGLPATVRETVDVHAGRAMSAAANADLIAMANSNPGALIGFGGDLQNLAKKAAIVNRSAKRLELSPLDNFSSSGGTGGAAASGAEVEMKKAFESIRQFFFTLGMAENNFNLNVVARTEQSAQAQDLANMLTSVQSMAATTKDPKVRQFIEAVSILAQNNELQVRAEIPQTYIASTITDKGLKMTKSTGGAAASRRAKTSATARRRRRG